MNETAGKFAPDGTALPYPGNTIICSVRQGSRELAALSRVREQLQAGEWAGKFVFLPADSYHMTLYRGVNDARRFPHEWPERIPLDASLEQVTKEFAARLSAVTLGDGFRLRPVGLEQCATGEMQLLLEGADAGETARLTAARAAIGKALSHSRPGEATYRLHLTFSYLLGALTEKEQGALHTRMADAFVQFVQDCPVVAVGKPRLCRYESMLAFYPVDGEGE